MPTLAQKALVVLHDQLRRDTKKKGKDLSFEQILGLISRRFAALAARGAAAAEKPAKEKGAK